MIERHQIGRQRNAMSSNLPRLGNRRLLKVLAYIEENLALPIKYASLCQIAALSRTHLGSTFKLSMGMTLHQYIILRRIERAKVLILDTELPLAEIAISVGFSSQSHMTSCFRKQSGMTPAQYRRYGS